MGVIALPLQRLRQSADPVLEAERLSAEQVASMAVGDFALRPRHLAELIQSLREQSLSALYRFEAISPQLRSLLRQKAL